MFLESENGLYLPLAGAGPNMALCSFASWSVHIRTETGNRQKLGVIQILHNTFFGEFRQPPTSMLHFQH